jgi:uncharacterized small protein (DUF1192 family)
MEDDDHPRRRSSGTGGDADLGAASLLAGESLDSYSLGELDSRITLLEAEIDRIRAHRSKTAAHMDAAHLLFGGKR